jgi:hypothetical protein
VDVVTHEVRITVGILIITLPHPAFIVLRMNAGL